MLMSTEEINETNINSIKKTKTRAEGQIDSWKKRLIDFSRRNQLLYFKPRTNLSVELTEACQEIFRKLVIEEESLLLREEVQTLNTSDFESEDENFSVPDLMDDMEEPDIEPISLDDDFIAGDSFPDRPFLQTNRDEKSLTQALNRIRSRARQSLNEHGINILYLGLNFVKWYDRNFKEFTKSPLILIPVSLSRKGMNAPSELNIIDDEIIVNPTLAYKLFHEYGIKFPEMSDYTLETVDDLKKVISDFEAIFKNQKDWEILDESTISLFSFAKLSMYKDLDENKPRILAHEVVRQICGEVLSDEEKLNYDPGALVNAEDIDVAIDANKNFQILDADSSQQEAIYAAKAGQSFVLQGPPGTGKSQTIANIISECLAQNKKILFVSEKKAALDVVVNRLKGSGLDKFCFELHGSKQKKSDIVANLKSSLEEIKELAVNTSRLPYLENINDVKREIRQGIDELHVTRLPINRSLYEIYGELAKLADVEDINFTISNLERITEKEIAELDYLFTQLEKKDEILNNYPNFLWRNATPTKLSFELETEIKSSFTEFQNVLAKLKTFAEPIAKTYFNREVNTIKEFKWLADACKLAVDSPFPKQEWFESESLEKVTDLTLDAKTEHDRCEDKKQYLMNKYSENFFSLNHSELLTKFTTEYVGVFKFLNIGYWKSMGEIRKTAIYNDTRGMSQIVNDLEEAIILKEQEQKIEGKESELDLALGNFYQRFDTNWEETLNAIKWVKKILNKLNQEQISGSLLTLVTDGNDQEDFEEFKSKADQLILAWELLKHQLNFYRSIFSIENVDIENLSFDKLKAHLDLLIENIYKIEDWIEFKDLKDRASQIGLKQYIDALINNPSKTNSSNIKDKFFKRFYQLWVDKIELESTSMRNFSGEQQSLLIERLNELDGKQASRVNVELSKNLAMNWIEYASNPINQEPIQLLNSELNKKRRHKPIRMLVNEIGELLVSLKPCWMMSPLTVSQMIDQNVLDFDIVIFDEASQIRTEDAIPAIYRGKQLVLAGDTHQLPPTDFFNLSMDDDEDSDEDHNNFESILDECSVFLENRTLNWHYRSRHESLISFSNAYIYDNKLVTFPSAVESATEVGIHFELVENGRYERGSRFNRNEAKRLAVAIMEHFKENPKQSLGVIAFSEAQQGAIERELNALLRRDREMEHFFSEDNTDSFFIKNLENVQGDERDVIFFSIGYARDRKGVLSHNFGPLNKAGGHRRLNVAVTRARTKLKVFSSITAQDIDLTRTGAKGAALLKQYLAYAQSCELEGAKAYQLFESSRLFDIKDKFTDLEESIAKAVEAKGYKVDRYLGTSNYRVDLAISEIVPEPEPVLEAPVLEAVEGEEPEPVIEEPVQEPKRFLLAIETDGYMYKSALTARDRERLRKQVLEALGWKVHRVWARDWVKNPEVELEKILQKLHN